MPTKLNIKNALKQTFKTISNKDILFNYTENINLEPLYFNKIPNTNKKLFYINYPDNTTYISYGRCIEYSLKSKQELFLLKDLTLSMQTYGDKKYSHLKLFGGVTFDMDSKARAPWKALPKELFLIPEF